jgi:Spy/CpxP family protein refolding chaperone
MKKTINWIRTTLVVIIVLVALAGIYKFNYLSSQEGYDIDGNETKSTVRSPYVGQESRGIKALSQDDVEGLLAGAGTPFGGMAKPAELNGYPGPRHVLDAFKTGELDLTNQQQKEVEVLYEAMKQQAINLGKRILDIENELDKAFKNKTITNNFLERAVAESTDAYSKLRVTHLKYHLQMVDVLSDEQVAQYNYLRGYTKKGGPCENIPGGHNTELWKLHNNC